MDVNTIDKDLSLEDFHNSGDGEADRTLSSASPADHTDFLSWVDSECQAVENSLSFWSILEMDILKLNDTVFWPSGSILEEVFLASFDSPLLRYLKQLHASVSVNQVALEVHEALETPCQVELDGQDVGQEHTQYNWILTR